MGWVPSDPPESKQRSIPSKDESDQAISIVSTIKDTARFGYQIPTYALSRGHDDRFTGIVFPGTHSNWGGILDSVQSLNEHKPEIANAFPDSVFDTGYIISSFLQPRDKKLDELWYVDQHKSQRITVVKSQIIDPGNTITVLGLPAMDGGMYGVPPYLIEAGYNRPPGRALHFFSFLSAEAKSDFENTLRTSRIPLQFINSIFAILFSPRSLTNLAFFNATKGFNPLIKDVQTVGDYGYKSIGDALNDFVGFGFSIDKSAKLGGNEKPLII